MKSPGFLPFLSIKTAGRSSLGRGNATEIGRGKGLGYAVNVPMLPSTGDDVFWEGFSALVPKLMQCFKPDVIVSQLGVDSFVEDPLASLQLTTDSFCGVISFLTDHAPAWVALGGGGYEVWNVALRLDSGLGHHEWRPSA